MIDVWGMKISSDSILIGNVVDRLVAGLVIMTSYGYTHSAQHNTRTVHIYLLNVLGSMR